MYINVVYTPALDSNEVEQYEFILMDNYKIVCNGYTKYDTNNNLTNRKKWKAIGNWNPYGRNSNLSEPVLSDIIKKRAKERLNEILEINGWKEYQENRFGQIKK